MEFEILDGRDSFYQWDFNQKLLVLDAAVEQVHFADGENALVCVVYEKDGRRLVDVPNILLQREGELLFFAVAGSRTLYSRRFRISGREKPDDYIYTETEIRSVEKIVEEMLADVPPQVDLTGYVKNTDIATTTKLGLVRCGEGLYISSSNGKINIQTATEANIAGKTTTGRAITPAVLDYAVKTGLCENKEAMSEAEKLAACSWLGTAVVAVRPDGVLSFTMADGSIYTVAAVKEA